MIVSSDDSRLGEYTGNAAMSPFVIVASSAGIRAIPSVVNAVVITSAWSSSNQAILSGTRVLYGLAIKRQAPAIFLRTTSWGVPYVCVCFNTCFMFLAFMSLSSSAMTVFYWLVDLTAAGVLVSWSCILLNHTRLCAAMHKQGILRRELPFYNAWTQYSSSVALVMCQIILWTGGFSVFTKGGWDAATFVSAYLYVTFVHSSPYPKPTSSSCIRHRLITIQKRYPFSHSSLPILEIRHWKNQSC